VTQAVALAGGDVQGDGHEELLVLGSDGRIFAVDNPKP
jgi:hypothetical protein